MVDDWMDRVCVYEKHGHESLFIISFPSSHGNQNSFIAFSPRHALPEVHFIDSSSSTYLLPTG
jgi:hypothetical protein